MTPILRLKWGLLLLGSIIAGSFITIVLIQTSIDWNWAVYFSEHKIWVYAAAPFVFLGMIIPLLIPFVFFLKYRKAKRNSDLQQCKRSLYAFLSSYVVMTLLKVFTNRVDMEPFEPIGLINTSSQFRFGFMNSNSWWESLSEGWPSGHTMIAVSMAIAIHPLIQRSARRWLNIAYAVLVSLSVSTAFHWLSDIVAGGLIGIVVGLFFSRYTYKVSLNRGS
jgi:membrane-associated phospholipid phosphatase